MNLLPIILIITCILAASATNAPCPVTLTDSNGQELNLINNVIKVALHGPLALVEVEMNFKNPFDREIEGRFLYLLPPGATVSRFAKTMFGITMEGEVVERDYARKVYRSILHTRRDPALLEQDQGNRFSTKVYPIPAQASFSVILSYTQVLPLKQGKRELTIPLAGLPKMPFYSFSSLIMPIPNERVLMSSPLQETIDNVLSPVPGEDQVYQFSETASDFQPSKDIRIVFESTSTSPRDYSLSSGNFQMIGVTPNLPAATSSKEILASRLFIDTSASNAESESRRWDALQAFLDDAPQLFTVQDAKAFDIEIVDMLSDSEEKVEPKEKHNHIITKLRNRHALGATNLEKVLKMIGEEARTQSGPSRFLLVSDGIPTHGCAELGCLLQALGEWPERAELQILVIGTKLDESILNGLAQAANGRVVKLPLYQKESEEQAKVMKEKVTEAWRQLLLPPGAYFEVVYEGQPDEKEAKEGAKAGPIEWVHPRKFSDVQPGDELVWFVSTNDDENKQGGGASIKLVQRKNGKDQEAKIFDFSQTRTQVVPQFAPLLRREGWAAHLQYLEEKRQKVQDPIEKEILKKKVVEISVKNRVMCAHTALLVLETEEDYVRYNIDRRALADILTVGARGIEIIQRMKPTRVPEHLDVFGNPHPLYPEGHLTSSSLSMTEVTKKEDKSYALFAETRRAKAVGNLQTPDMFKQAEATEQRFLLVAGTSTLSYALGSMQASNDASEDADGLQREGDPMALPVGSVGISYALGSMQANGGASEDAAGPQIETKQTALPVGGSAALASGIGPPPQTGESTWGASFPLSGRFYSLLTNPASSVEPAAFRFPKQILEQAPSVPRPAWTVPRPADLDLKELHSAVQANPSDRKLQISYGHALVQDARWQQVIDMVYAWLPYDPENTQAYEFLGKAAHALRDKTLALRAFSSIAEVAPSDSAQLERAGFMMLTIGEGQWADDFFSASLRQRNDNPNVYRGLALARWTKGEMDEAAKVLEDVIAKESFHSRYGDAKRVLTEELGYIYRSWSMRKGVSMEEIEGRAAKAGVELRAFLGEQPPDAFRVTLSWETDANDVDLHVVDPWGHECFYARKKLDVSGLELYSDQTRGLGPEVIRAAMIAPGKYSIGVKYYSAGPMGTSRGVIVLHHTTRPQDMVLATPPKVEGEGGEGGQEEEGGERPPMVIPFSLLPEQYEVQLLVSLAY